MTNRANLEVTTTGTDKAVVDVGKVETAVEKTAAETAKLGAVSKAASDGIASVGTAADRTARLLAEAEKELARGEGLLQKTERAAETGGKGYERYGAQVAAVHDRVAALRTEIEAAGGSFSGMAAKIDGQRERLDASAVTAAKTAARQDDLRKQVSAASAAIGEQRGKVVELDDVLQRVSPRVADFAIKWLAAVGILNLAREGVGKVGDGAEFLAGRLGASGEEARNFGSIFKDVAELKLPGTTVAMANVRKGLQDLADELQHASAAELDTAASVDAHAEARKRMQRALVELRKEISLLDELRGFKADDTAKSIDLVAAQFERIKDRLAEDPALYDAFKAKLAELDAEATKLGTDLNEKTRQALVDVKTEFEGLLPPLRDDAAASAELAKNQQTLAAAVADTAKKLEDQVVALKKQKTATDDVLRSQLEQLEVQRQAFNKGPEAAAGPDPQKQIKDQREEVTRLTDELGKLEQRQDESDDAATARLQKSAELASAQQRLTSLLSQYGDEAAQTSGIVRRSLQDQVASEQQVEASLKAATDAAASFGDEMGDTGADAKNAILMMVDHLKKLQSDGIEVTEADLLQLAAIVDISMGNAITTFGELADATKDGAAAAKKVADEVTGAGEAAGASGEQMEAWGKTVDAAGRLAASGIGEASKAIEDMLRKLGLATAPAAENATGGNALPTRADGGYGVQYGSQGAKRMRNDDGPGGPGAPRGTKPNPLAVVVVNPDGGGGGGGGRAPADLAKGGGDGSLSTPVSPVTPVTPGTASRAAGINTGFRQRGSGSMDQGGGGQGLGDRTGVPLAAEVLNSPACRRVEIPMGFSGELVEVYDCGFMGLRDDEGYRIKAALNSSAPGNQGMGGNRGARRYGSGTGDNNLSDVLHTAGGNDLQRGSAGGKAVATEDRGTQAALEKVGADIVRELRAGRVADDGGLAIRMAGGLA